MLQLQWRYTQSFSITSKHREGMVQLASHGLLWASKSCWSIDRGESKKYKEDRYLNSFICSPFTTITIIIQSQSLPLFLVCAGRVLYYLLSRSLNLSSYNHPTQKNALLGCYCHCQLIGSSICSWSRHSDPRSKRCEHAWSFGSVVRMVYPSDLLT